MSYFPAFLDLENKKILIVGGGNIAYEKLEHLLDFSANISIIAKGFSAQMLEMIETNNLHYEKRAYINGEIKEFDIVVVAVDDISLQSEIFSQSKQYNCLCNAVDSVDYCDFIFPAYIKKGDLTIAISTSGSSPAMAKNLKLYLLDLIPHDIADFLQEMKNLRKILPKGKQRMKFLDDKVKEYMKKWNK